MLRKRVNQKTTANFRSKRHSLTLQLCLTLTIALALFIGPLATSDVLAEGEITHIVRPGESLSSIAARYGVTVGAIARYNGISNINLLRVGQSLQIPGATLSPAPAQIEYPTPTRAPSDNNGIIQPNSTLAPAPAATPYLVEPNSPRPTSTRVVPTRVPPISLTRVHTVTAADTLTGIANLYGTSAWAIKSRNGLTSDRIYRGQRLIIP